MMRIEAYLFVPWQGQYRFAFNAFGGRQLMKSDEDFDYYWGSRLRSNPTLFELTDAEASLPNSMRQQYESDIQQAFEQVRGTVMKNKRAKLHVFLPSARENKPYVEFVQV